MATKKQGERRNETIQIKVTRTERQQLEQRAERDKVTLSDAGRQAILKDLSGATNIAQRGRPS